MYRTGNRNIRLFGTEKYRKYKMYARVIVPYNVK